MRVTADLRDSPNKPSTCRLAVEETPCDFGVRSFFAAINSRQLGRLVHATQLCRESVCCEGILLRVGCRSLKMMELTFVLIGRLSCPNVSATIGWLKPLLLPMARCLQRE